MVGKLAVCDYAHFCVPRLLKYGPNEIKKKVIEALFGNILSMLSRPKSTTIIDTVYMSYANSNHKALMRQELYGDLYKTVRIQEKCSNCIVLNSQMFSILCIVVKGQRSQMYS